MPSATLRCFISISSLSFAPLRLCARYLSPYSAGVVVVVVVANVGEADFDPTPAWISITTTITITITTTNGAHYCDSDAAAA